MNEILVKEETADNGLKIKYFRGNILDGKMAFLLHQVNCQGVMGAGIAKQIKLKWPNVYMDYIDAIREYRNNFVDVLGKMSMSYVGDYHHTWINYVVNLFGQDKYGRNGRYTNYDALREALGRFVNLLEFNIDKSSELTIIGIPYKMSCGLAGGDWDMVFGIIKETFEPLKNDIELHIYQLE